MAFWDGILRDKQEIDDLLTSYRSFDGHNWERMPLVASLLLTYKCNLKCAYCPFHVNFESSDTRPVDAWEKLIEKMAEVGVRRLSFSGGEPLLYPGIGRLVKKATKLGISKGIVTNGTVLNVKKLEMFAKAGLNALTFSLDTVDADLYSRICKTSPDVLNRVLDMVKFSNRLGSFWTGINTVITSINVKALAPVIEFCSRHDLPLQFQIFNPYSNVEDLLPATDDIREVMNIIKECKKAGAPIVNSEEYLDACCEFVMMRQFPKRMECMVPFIEMVVTPNMRLKACCTSSELGEVSGEWGKIWLEGESNCWRLKAKCGSCQDCFLIYHEPLRVAK